jgi:hypothetical protein
MKKHSANILKNRSFVAPNSYIFCLFLAAAQPPRSESDGSGRAEATRLKAEVAKGLERTARRKERSDEAARQKNLR